MRTDTYPTIPKTPAPRSKRRFRGGQRFVLFLLAMGVLAIFAGVAYITWTESRIDRIPAAELESLTPLSPVGGTETVNFLVVGTDDRASLPDDWDENFGTFTGRRADVIMLAHLVPGERIQLLSLPRDLKVSIPGNGTNRVNAAYVFGGPDLLVETVQAETGIPIHHYVEIDFGGFGKVVDALGGVDMEFTYAGRDGKSGFRMEAGSQTLDGEDAVAYARSRHYEIYRDGSWQSTRGGDVARTGRQQEILIRLFDQVTSASSAFNLPTFLPTFADQITADEGLSLGLMAELGRTALTLRSKDIDSATIPVKSARGEDGRSYVVPVDGYSAMLEAFRNGDPLSP